jgi:CheY-like chemotaxis protein
MMHRKTVLVASPDADIRVPLTQALLQRGYGVLEAAGNTQAIEKAALDLPTMVLIHTGAAGLDGWTTVKLLGESPRTDSMPVAILAVPVTDGDRRQAALLGCTGIAPADRVEAILDLVSSAIGPPQTSQMPSTPPRVARIRYRPSRRGVA